MDEMKEEQAQSEDAAVSSERAANIPPLESNEEGYSAGDLSGVPPKSQSRRRMVRIVSVLTSAILAAVAAAIISPERFDQVMETIFGSGGGTDIRYQLVSSPDGALTVQVPDSWFSVAANPNLLEPYDVDRQPDAGSAIIASTRIDDGPPWGEDRVFFAASTDAADYLGLDSLGLNDLQVLVDELAASADWASEKCKLIRDDARVRAGWIVASRTWDDCAGIPGTRVWEYYAAMESGEVLVNLVVSLSADTPPGVAERVLASWEVAVEKIPTS